MWPASPLCVFAAVGVLSRGCNAFVPSPASIRQGLALPRQCGATCNSVMRLSIRLKAGAMADEVSEDDQKKARADFLDSPMLDDLMKTLNKLRGFVGMADDDAGETDTKTADAEEEPESETGEAEAEPEAEPEAAEETPDDPNSSA